MKILLNSLLLFVILISFDSCTQKKESIDPFTDEAIERARVREIIHSGKRPASGARTLDGYIFSLSPNSQYSYTYAPSANGYKVDVTARYMIGPQQTSFPSTAFKLSGQYALILDGPITATGGSSYFADPMNDIENGLIWTIPANTMYAELKFTLKMRAPGSYVEGIYTIQKYNGPAPNYTDDFLYIIQGN